MTKQDKMEIKPSMGKIEESSRLISVPGQLELALELSPTSNIVGQLKQVPVGLKSKQPVWIELEDGPDMFPSLFDFTLSTLIWLADFCPTDAYLTLLFPFSS